MQQDISIVIPITNQPRYLGLLSDCIKSIQEQDVIPEEVVLVYDGPVPLPYEAEELINLDQYIYWNIVEVPYRVGVPNAFNIGVASATHDLVIMTGCDDILRPNCIDACLQSYTKPGYYWINVEFDDGVIYNQPCGHAMIHKEFWNRIGGYPLEAPMACDAALISMIWDTPDLIPVGGDPLITVRRHPTTYTGSRDPRWVDVILRTRELLTTIYKEQNDITSEIAPRTL